MMPEKLLNNRYQTTSQLSSSRFSETFLAIDSHISSPRQCVIKQLKTVVDEDLQSQELQERFLKEAKVLEELGQHPQIPQLYAYFCEEDRFYLVLEWIEGDTLTYKLKREGVMNENAVKNILENMLPVISFIHDRRIIHQDIKPNNIVIQSDGQPVLIDFGAVKTMMRATENADNPFTINIGTPGFIAPEQAMGTPIFASDLCSLGLTAIYLLTGKLLKDMTNRKTGEIMWRAYAGNINHEFADILDKAIAYNPSDRYGTAIEMLDAIRAVSTVSDSTLHSGHRGGVNMPVATPPSSQENSQVPLTQPSLTPPTEVSSTSKGALLASPNRELRSRSKNPYNSGWLKLIMTAIFAGIIATIIGIFWTSKNPDKVTPEPEAKRILAPVDIGVIEVVDMRKNPPIKSELKKATKKMPKIALGTEFDDKIKAQKEEYGKIVKKIDIELNKEVSDDLLSKVNCWELPMSLP